MPSSAAPDDWINAPSPAQLGQARMLQGQGLSGDFGGGIFTWRRGNEAVAESGPQPSAAEAFAEATAKLPQ